MSSDEEFGKVTKIKVHYLHIAFKDVLSKLVEFYQKRWGVFQAERPTGCY